MSDLTLTAIYDSKRKGLSAFKVLSLARHGLELLNALEREQTKRSRARIPWQVNIYSLSDRAVVEFSAFSSSSNRALVRDIAGQAARAESLRAHTAQATQGGRA